MKVHHTDIEAGTMFGAVRVWKYHIAYHHPGISWSHSRREIFQDDHRFFVGPIVKDIGHVIYAGTYRSNFSE